MGDYHTSLTAIRSAADNIKGVAIRTPIFTSNLLDRMAGLRISFKAELLQKTGSFKFRGMYNAVCEHKSKSLNNPRPVVIHSSGNAGQALALASKLLHVQCDVVMPSTASSVKKAAVLDYGARVTVCQPTEASREAMKDQIMADTEAVFIGASNHPDVMSGAGTIGLEILDDVPDVEAVVVSVGGGGMLSGIAMAIKSVRPDVLVIAAEPANTGSCSQSMSAGSMVKLAAPPQTCADSLKVSLGEYTWPIIRDFVDSVIQVSEEDIIRATMLIWQRMKLTIEPGSGVSVAVALGNKIKHVLNGRTKVAVVLCGGNVDLVDMLTIMKELK